MMCTDDSVGHWQVMGHPNKSGWSRVLYSTQAKLMPWIPEPVVQFISKKALTEATGWLKREAELEQIKQDKMRSEQLSQNTAAPSTNAVPSKSVKSGPFGWFRGGGVHREGGGVDTVSRRVRGLLHFRFGKSS